ncbi:hypothetical protein Tco_1548743 [Tanacetum coccineum]
MENANPPPTNNPPVLPTALCAKVVQELNKLPVISAYIDSRLDNIDQFLNGFTQPPNEIDKDDLEPDDELVDTPLVSPFLDSNDDISMMVKFLIKDIREFILRDMAKVVMGKPFREVTKLEYDYAKGLMSFTRIFDNYTFQMPCTIPRFKSWGTCHGVKSHLSLC